MKQNHNHAIRKDLTVNLVSREKRPPLSNLIQGSKIIGDVQFLLDFAIIGHPKTGTGTHEHHLARHEEIKIYDHEVRLLRDGKEAAFVKKMYDLPEGTQYKRGYKAPRDLVVAKNHPLRLINMYWPKTKLIVGVRHPVKWFESYYNFLMRDGRHQLPPAEKMIGEDIPNEVLYHKNLARLGKTNPHGDPREAKLLGISKKKKKALHVMKNPVFLYDSSQPFDLNNTRAEIYWQDLSNYIGVSKPLEPPGYMKSSRNSTVAINICDKKFQQLRSELVEIGKAASDWIQNYFMIHPDVKVSSPKYFKEELNTWQTDPCLRQ